MKARLIAVQRVLLLLVLTAVFVAGITVPRPDDRGLALALTELSAFQLKFARQDAEARLRRQVESTHGLALHDVARAMQTELGPLREVRASEQGLTPLSSVSLASLGDVEAFARAGGAVAVALPSADAMATALTFRVLRADLRGTLTVESAELVRAEVSAEQTEREQRLLGLEAASTQATTALQRAAQRLARADQRLQARKKRRARSIEEYQELYDAERESFDEKTREQAELVQRYESDAQRAESFRATALKSSAEKAPGLPPRAVVRVRLSHDGSARSFDIPVDLTPQNVRVDPLRAPGLERGFVALRASGRWAEVKQLEAEVASARLRGQLHWQFKHVNAWGIELSGAHALQLLPCLLVALLALLLRRVRRAAASYSPFTARAITSLPRVGFKYRVLELLALVLLPLLSTACAGLALVVLGQLPILPALTAIACVVLGSDAFMKLQELRDLSVSIEHYHSYPPPPLLTGSARAITRV